MKRFLIPFVVAACLSLGGCGHPVTSIQEQNTNPLTASRYGDELADTMADMIIKNDPLSQDKTARAIIDDAIVRGKRISEAARDLQAEGFLGMMISVDEEVTGYALYLDDMLYLSSDFETKPGPNLHVFLTVLVDPRGQVFPDKTAVDLGVIQNPFGAQQYSVPHQKDPAYLRTLVLYDKNLKRAYGFSQLGKH